MGQGQTPGKVVSNDKIMGKNEQKKISTNLENFIIIRAIRVVESEQFSVTQPTMRDVRVKLLALR